MHAMKKLLVMVFLITAVLAMAAFDSRQAASRATQVSANELTRHIALLKSRDAQQKAAAAYWLGLQRSSAVTAVNSLVALLGDKTEVDAARYHETRNQSATRQRKLTVGEEAAAALVNIGPASTDALIEVLKSSPEPHARKNAAWALGAIREERLGDGASGAPDQTRFLRVRSSLVG